MRLSVIIPTRNRAPLWRSGWTIKPLLAQTDPPDELLVALDNPDDDTLAAVQDATRSAPFPVRILELLAGRPGPNPASAIPDNCLFHAATGDILLHLDDDCHCHPDLCRQIRTLLATLPRAIIWLLCNFVDEDHRPLANYDRRDCRADMAARHKWPTLPGGIAQLPSNRILHWGPAWAVPRREILAIGGHCLALAQFHNSDTRLGNRLTQNGCSSFIGLIQELSVDHLGPTWHAKHKHDQHAIRESNGPFYGRIIANGGPNFWDSDWIRAAYRELDTHTNAPTI